MGLTRGESDGPGQVVGRAALPILVTAPALHGPVGLQRTHVVVGARDGHHVAGCGGVSWDEVIPTPTGGREWVGKYTESGLVLGRMQHHIVRGLQTSDQKLQSEVRACRRVQ